MAKKIFKEEQRFGEFDLVIVLGLFSLVILYFLSKEFMISDNDYFISEISSILLLSVIGYWVYVLFKSQLKTTISKKSIKVRFHNWRTTKQKIQLDQIQNYSIIKTPLSNKWHGGNIFFGYEKYYSLCGRNGLSITTKDGKQYFIGSKSLAELESAISSALRKEK